MVLTEDFHSQQRGGGVGAVHAEVAPPFRFLGASLLAFRPLLCARTALLQNVTAILVPGGWVRGGVGA